MSAESKHIPGFKIDEEAKEREIEKYRVNAARKNRAKIDWLLNEHPIKVKAYIARLLSILEAQKEDPDQLVLGPHGGRNN